MEEKAQQQFNLVESFGSEKQKRLLANARRSKVDIKDLDSSLTNALPVVENQCKIVMYTTNCIHSVSVESLPFWGISLLDTCYKHLLSFTVFC